MSDKTSKAAVAEELRRLKHAEPFAPFRIRTSQGSELTVDGADFFIVSPRGNTALLYPREQEGLRVLDLSDVVSIERTVQRRRRAGRRKPDR